MKKTDLGNEAPIASKALGAQTQNAPSVDSASTMILKTKAGKIVAVANSRDEQGKQLRQLEKWREATGEHLHWQAGNPPPLPMQWGDCPRSKWYAKEGRRLRSQGWRLRSDGPRWNLTHALIEREQTPRCKCGNLCAWYGFHGGFSVKCTWCNAHNAALKREGRARINARDYPQPEFTKHLHKTLRDFVKNATDAEMSKAFEEANFDIYRYVKGDPTRILSSHGKSSSN